MENKNEDTPVVFWFPFSLPAFSQKLFFMSQHLLVDSWIMGKINCIFPFLFNCLSCSGQKSKTPCHFGPPSMSLVKLPSLCEKGKYRTPWINLYVQNMRTNHTCVDEKNVLPKNATKPYFLTHSIWAVYQFEIALVSPVIATLSKVLSASTAKGPSFTNRPTHLPCLRAAATILSMASTKTGSSPLAGV